MSTTISHWDNGRAIAGGDRFGDVFNPATGEVQAQVALADPATVNAAVDAAKAAFPAWADTPPLRRARVMFKFRELLEDNLKAFAALVTAEHGKVLSDAEGSIIRGLEVVEFAAGIPHLLKGEFTEQVGPDIDSWSTRQLLGVCAGITPFNFPAMVPMWMFRGHRLRQHLHFETIRPEFGQFHGRTAEGSRAAGWCLQRPARRQSGG